MVDPESAEQDGDAAPARRAIEAHVRERAYFLWEAEGKPHGREDEYWHRARELLEDETQSGYPPAQSRGHRT